MFWALPLERVLAVLTAEKILLSLFEGRKPLSHKSTYGILVFYSSLTLTGGYHLEDLLSQVLRQYRFGYIVWPVPFLYLISFVEVVSLYLRQSLRHCLYMPRRQPSTGRWIFLAAARSPPNFSKALATKRGIKRLSSLNVVADWNRTSSVPSIPSIVSNSFPWVIWIVRSHTRQRLFWIWVSVIFSP